ncbi:MAG TPA: PAS domain S-box protein, partial [Blastocatellia bacterium]|nr:PAS domain S-box protein [Blastocatellia bacterium]
VTGVLEVNIDITDRKRGEEALRESEGKFRALAESTAAAIFIYRGDKLLYVNPATKVHTGYDAGELLSTSFMDVIHPDYRDIVRRRALARQRGEEVPERYEFKIITKSGEARWIDATASILEYEGRPAAIGTAFDITAHKRAEEELRAAQDKLHHVLLYSPAIIYSLKVEGSRLITQWISESLTRLTGYEVEEAFSGTWWVDHIHPDDRERVVETMHLLFVADRLVLEYRFQYKEKGYVWLHDEIRLLRDDSGDPIEAIGSWVDVTQRREAEEALRDSEERFRKLVSSIKDTVFTLDREHRITGIFGSSVNGSDLKPEEFIGKLATELFGLEGGLIHHQAAARALAGEQVIYDWSLVQNQNTLHYQTSLAPMRNQSGEVTGLVGVGRDITERKLAEEALHASEERYRDLVENARDIIYSHDLKGNYTSVNRAVERITGYTREEALNLNFEQSVAPEYIETARQMIAAKLAGQQETVYDLEIMAKDGRRITVEVNTRLVFQDDVPVGVHGIARDVTERKLAERALRESESRLQAILDNCPAMIFEKDLDGRYLQINRQFERTFDLAPAQVLGRTDDDLFPQELAAGFQATDRQVIEAGHALEFEERAVYADGLHHYIVHKFPLHDVAGDIYGVGGISTDITARKSAEDELRKQKEIFQKIFDHIPVMIRFLGREGHIKLVNREWERVCGWSQNEITANNLDIFSELYPDPEYRQYVLDFIAASTGEFADFKTTARDGRVIDTRFASVRLEDGTNIGIGRDITEKKLAEESLREAQARTDSILASVADAHIIFDREWRYIYLNKAAAEGMGRPPEEILGRTLWEVYPDIIGTALELQYHLAMQERAFVAFDFHYLPLDTWWENHFYPVPEGLAVFATNITERKRAEEVASRRTAQLAALHEIELEISSQNELSRVLDVVTHRAAELLSAYHCSIYIYEHETDQLRLVASLDSDLIGLRLKRGEGLTGQVAVAGEVRVVGDYSEWQGRVAAFEGKGFGPALVVPLKWQQKVTGTISLARKRGEEEFTDDDSSLLKQLAAEAAIAIHQATLFDELQESRARLQVLSHRLIDSQEAERKRLARELHDQIGQALTAIQISLQAAKSQPAGGADAIVEDCLAIIDESLQLVHDLSFDLRPSLLDDLGLGAALRWYVERATTRADLLACLNVDVLGGRFSSEVETACFRIAQESLTNVVRHASARTVFVTLAHEEDCLKLTVKDDGVGFDVHEALDRKGRNTSLGLQGMRERASALGGTVEIKSNPGNGTAIEASFPI